MQHPIYVDMGAYQIIIYPNGKVEKLSAEGDVIDTTTIKNDDYKTLNSIQYYFYLSHSLIYRLRRCMPPKGKRLRDLYNKIFDKIDADFKVNQQDKEQTK